MSTYCIIMAGGVGSRFWPMSRNAKPKQFLDILGVGRTFLQMTYDRFAKIIPPERIIVVTSMQYAALVREQLPQLPDENILKEPFRRNTAPCIAYASYKIMERDPRALVVVAPADHVIINEEAFLQTIEAAFVLAEKKKVLITLGITPTRPDTNFGYIQAQKSSSAMMNGREAFEVKTFTEKPNLDLAKVFVESGEFFWNSGLFIWSLPVITREMGQLIPDIDTLFRNGKGVYDTAGETAFIGEAYSSCKGISIDYGVLEKSEHVWVVAANFGWSDLGTWESYYLHKGKDKNGNVIDAPMNFLEDVEGSVVITENKDKLIVVKGLKNYLVVNTKDVLVVCPRDEKTARQLVTDISLSKGEKYI
jgi:Mannose-1-phosphate guanylyltransferase